MDASEKKRRRRRRGRIALGVLGVLAGGIALFHWWQPWEFDVIPRRLPSPNPPVSPDLPRLFAPGTRVAVVTAHPDDSEFYVGGLLLELAKTGADLSLILATDGDKAYYPFEDWQRNRRVRRQEQIEAARRWGCDDVRFLAFPDGRLRANDALVAALRRELESLRPEYVIGFDPAHPPRFSHADHRRAGEATFRAAQGLPGLRWYLGIQTAAPNWVFDISDRWDRKMELVAVHQSQFAKEMQFISGLIRGQNAAAGQLIGVELGEGLRAIPMGR